MTRIKPMTLLFFVFVAFFTFSQQSYTIKVNVTSELDTLLFGNLILLNPKDSSVIKGALFNNGVGEIGSVTDLSALLKITSFGFQDTILEIDNSQGRSILELPLVTMLPIISEFGEVTVVYKKPLFEIGTDGSIEVNVENTALSGSGSLLDVLRKSPNVIVDNNDNVLVFGKGTALIYIDGQLIPSSDILKALPSTDIKTIRVIENPSSKYDAAGRAVIAIETKNSKIKGYNGELIQLLTFSEYFTSYTGIQMYYKGEKWDINGGYGIKLGTTWSSDNYHREYYNEDTLFTLDNTIYNKNRLTSNHNYRLGVNYAFNSKNKIGVSLIGGYVDQTTSVDNKNIVSSSGFLPLTLLTYTEAKPTISNNTLSTSFRTEMDTLGSEFNVVGQYSRYKSITNSSIVQFFSQQDPASARESRNLGENNINILSGRLDWTKFFMKNLWLELGAKHAYIFNQSDIRFENRVDNNWYLDSSIYNSFRYDENILAGYAQLNHTYGKLSTRVGVRVEWTRTKGFSDVTNQQVIDLNYTKAFPSANIGYVFNDTWSTGLTFSSRIRRPSYQDLDPFINYIDSLSSIRGNPFLLPETTNALEWSVTYKKKASIKLEYTNAQNAINLVVEQLNDPTNSFVATMRNLDKSATYKLGLVVPFELTWWTTFNTFGGAYNQFSYQSAGGLVNISKPMFYFNSYNEFRIKKLLSIEVGYLYNSSGVDGIFEFGPTQSLFVSLSKNFFGNRLRCRLIGNDILGTYRLLGETDIDSYQMEYESRFNSRFVRLSLIWKFGKLKSDLNQENKVDKDEIDRIKTD